MNTKQLCDMATAITNLVAERDELATRVDRLLSSQHQAALDHDAHTALLEKVRAAELNLRFKFTELDLLEKKHALLKDAHETLLANYRKLEARLPEHQRSV